MELRLFSLPLFWQLWKQLQNSRKIQ